MLGDLCVSLFVIKGKTTQDMLMNVHHFLSFSSCIICLGVGYGFVYAGMLTTLMEYSTIPVNYRTLMVYSEVVGPIGNFTDLLFFVLYTVFRIFLLPYITWKIYMCIGNMEPYLDTTTKFFMYTVYVEFILLTIMSYYWYIGLLKVIGKALGFIKRGSKAEDNQKPWLKNDN